MPAKTRRSTRQRNQKKDDDSDQDEIFSGERTGLSAVSENWQYDIMEKVGSPNFCHPELIEKFQAKDFNIEYIKRTGLNKPLLFVNALPSELGMKMPRPNNFGVNDVKNLVGSNRKVEVVEVKSQKSRIMKLGEFVKYYKSKPGKRRHLWNLLSLEFSMTDLEKRVRSPELIKSVDWVELFWPKELRERQKNLPRNAKYDNLYTYPKVQNYCLMSVAECYTDFHIDFGGTSVWYHVLKGEKIFWMVEPTDQNLEIYEQWILSGQNQDCTFFGDIVEKCARIRLLPGHTFIIPSGWIHGVYTPVDSLVFGGNFLHSYAIPMQLRMHISEKKTHIRKKYRYPEFVPMLWYVAERTVRRATKRRYLHEISAKFETSSENFRCSYSNSLNTWRNSAENDPDFDIEMTGKSDKVGQLVEERPELSPEMDTASDEKAELMRQSDKNSFLGMEIQQRQEPEFIPVTEFDDKYLLSITALERDGLIALMNYLMKLHKDCRELGEGIREPDHLLKDLQASLCQLCSLTEDAAEKDGHFDFDAKIDDILEEYPAKVPGPKRKGGSFDLPAKKKRSKFVETKPTIVEEKEKSVEKLLTHEFDPMDSLVPLGHRPLPTAFRKGPNMATISSGMKPAIIAVKTTASSLLPLGHAPRSVTSSTSIAMSSVRQTPRSILNRSDMLVVCEQQRHSTDRQVRSSYTVLPDTPTTVRIPVETPTSSNTACGISTLSLFPPVSTIHTVDKAVGIAHNKCSPLTTTATTVVIPSRRLSECGVYSKSLPPPRLIIPGKLASSTTATRKTADFVQEMDGFETINELVALTRQLNNQDNVVDEQAEEQVVDWADELAKLTRELSQFDD